MVELCAKVGGVLSAATQEYLDEVDAATQRGAVINVGAMANCPFEPLYRARTALRLVGADIPADYEFHWDIHRGHIEAEPRFARSNDWEECTE